MSAGMSVQTRFRVWQGAVAAWIAAWGVWVGGFWWTGGKGGIGVAGETTWLIGGWGMIGLIALGVVWLLRTTPPDAIVLPRKRSERVILGVGAVLLLGTMLGVEPTLSTDHHRYLLEGEMWLSGVSPYRVSPEAFAGESRAAEIGVNHPELRSIYPPTAQAVFALCAGIGRVTGGDGGLWALRGLAGLAAMAGAVLLLRLLEDRQRSAWWAAVVVWSAVWVMETAGTPHVDVFGVALMLAACRLAKPTGTAAARFFAGVMLGLACGVKPQVGVALPFLVRATGWAGLAGFAAVAGAMAGVLQWQGGWHGFLETSRLYATSWEANGSLFELLKSLAVFGEDPHAIERLKDVGRLSGPVALVLTGWLMWHYRAGVVTALYGMQGVLLLTSPVVYPWYVLWVLPLGVLVGRGGTAAVLAATTVGLSYLLGRLGQGWTLPWWVLLAEWLPVYAALAWTLVDGLRGRENTAHPRAAGDGDTIRV